MTFTPDILYEDYDMVIINKPAGLPVHSGPKGGDNIEDLVQALYKDAKPCLKKLSTKYKLGILCNTTPWTARDHHQLQIDKYVKASVLSCRVGAAKPDIKIFTHAQKIMGFDAQKLLYVGDSFEYDVKPALKAGWKAILLCRDKNNKKSLAPIISDLFKLENIIRDLNKI